MPETMSTEPAVVLTTARNVPLTKDVRAATIEVADVFLKTAVKRDHPERAWDVVHPALREGYTKASWATGDIPVVPYPVDAAIYRLDYSHPNTRRLEGQRLPAEGFDAASDDLLHGRDALGLRRGTALAGQQLVAGEHALVRERRPGGAQQGSNPYAINRQTGDDLESRINPLWLLLAFVPLAFVVLVVGAKGVRDWRRTAAVERDYRSTSNPS